MEEHDVHSYEALSYFIDSVSRANLNTKLEIAYSDNTYFHNTLGRTVIVVLRSGKRITIPSSTRTGLTPDIFTIRKNWSRHSGVKVDHPQLSDAAWDNEIRLLTESHLAYGYNTNVSGLDTDYTLTLDDLVSNGGYLYFSQLDIVIALEHPTKDPYHPYSTPGLIHSLSKEDAVLGLDSKFIYGITIVDRHRLFGEKFININGIVYPVGVISKDTKYPDGVYLLTSGDVGSAGGSRGITAQKMTFEEAREKLKLYSTYNEALIRGDYEAEEKYRRHKLAMEKMDREKEADERASNFKKLKDELERAECQRRLEETANAAKLEAMKQERARIEHDLAMRALERKDHYEEKSFWRKSVAEVAKYLPSVVGALVTAGIIIVKVKGKS